MNKVVQEVHAGHLQNVFNIQKRQFKENDLLRRFWSRDCSLWTKGDSCRLDIDSNLAWLDFPALWNRYSWKFPA